LIFFLAFITFANYYYYYYLQHEYNYDIIKYIILLLTFAVVAKQMDEFILLMRK